MTTITHAAVWQAIDTLAKRHGMSPSGLAILAGFDPCCFNPSKRIDQFGKPRWPNLSTVARCLEVTGETLNGFAALVDEAREAAQ
ncbi:MAG: hypothetical protein ACLGJC_09570 [Alphaproteobacteria bacterium]